jgi:hypothetical protein
MVTITGSTNHELGTPSGHGTDGGRSGHEAIAAALARPLDTSSVVAEPPYPGPGAWTGAPSALLVDGIYWLAYRLRRAAGRGYANVVARSDDGVTFEPVATLHRDGFGAASLERPALALTDDGRWRVYVSCATPNTDHWRVELVEADTPEGLATGTVRTVLPGDDRHAVKDPVILRDERGWHLWASCHPLNDPAHTDRMTTEYASSDDGVHWHWRGRALAGRPGRWDARGVRVTTVLLDHGSAVAFYDGRASAVQNWEECTGVAFGDPRRWGRFTAFDDHPVGQSPDQPGGLRYLSVVILPDGTQRLYFELTRADGAHELRTMLIGARP